MGMAANPSGAHQAGRVFTGRIDEMCVSVRDRRTLARAARFTGIQKNQLSLIGVTLGSGWPSHLYSKCAPVRTLLTRAGRKQTIQSLPGLRTLRYHRPFD